MCTLLALSAGGLMGTRTWRHVVGRLVVVLISIIGFSVSFLVQASTGKASTIKSQAFFIKSDNNLFKSLDLKRKTFKFSKADRQLCQDKLIRLKDTLHFSCTLPLPERSASITRKHNQITPVLMIVPFAGIDRRVYVTVNEKVTEVTYATEFDTAGFDLEFAKFNDDFYRVYSKTALNIFSDAMAQKLKLETLESKSDTRLAN